MYITQVCYRGRNISRAVQTAKHPLNTIRKLKDQAKPESLTPTAAVEWRIPFWVGILEISTAADDIINFPNVSCFNHWTPTKILGQKNKSSKLHPDLPMISQYPWPIFWCKKQAVHIPLFLGSLKNIECFIWSCLWTATQKTLVDAMENPSHLTKIRMIWGYPNDLGHLHIWPENSRLPRLRFPWAWHPPKGWRWPHPASSKKIWSAWGDDKGWYTYTYTYTYTYIYIISMDIYGIYIYTLVGGLEHDWIMGYILCVILRQLPCM